MMATLSSGAPAARPLPGLEDAERIGGLAASETRGFLRDAFDQLDQVLRRKVQAEQRAGSSSDVKVDSELKASQQMIQRWLVVFAREHLVDICEKLMTAMDDVAPGRHDAAHAVRKSQLARKADKPANLNQLRDNSAGFFLLDSLRRVLAASVDSPSPDALDTLRAAPSHLLAFCFERLHVTQTVPVQHAASQCIGLLSRARLHDVVAIYVDYLSRVSTEREEREFVPYQRAASHLELSVRSADQTASSIRYVTSISASMGRFNRGVLRREVCAPAEPSRAHPAPSRTHLTCQLGRISACLGCVADTCRRCADRSLRASRG